MKIRTIKYMIQEGFVNTYKNFLMTLASTSMVIASLLIFGIFLMIAINIHYNFSQLENQFEVVIFLKPEISELEFSSIHQEIINNDNVNEVIYVSKEEAFEDLKGLLDDTNAIETYTPDFLNETFRIRLIDPEYSQEFIDSLSMLSGIESIESPKEYIEHVAVLLKWINIGSMIVLTMLLIISVSIIANTIKLTVYARRKEINIMKYVGANDWLIRWPFIIEGVIIGFMGAIASFILTNYGYNTIESYVNAEIAEKGMKIIDVVPFINIGTSVFLIYIIIGMVMGAIGSIISVRKHLNV